MNMNNAREAIRVMQPDGTIKIVFRIVHENPAKKEEVKEVSYFYLLDGETIHGKMSGGV
ncbi:MAG: hypothetical protein AMDU4_FER2C00009G0004 [Ferroplasma sp. Type II]|jgi:hypothetical protein|nr:MAG: hypothetical protein AMDU4_FER2C00009G0004 [Ferroplasma sp. Type II]